MNATAEGTPATVRTAPALYGMLTAVSGVLALALAVGMTTVAVTTAFDFGIDELLLVTMVLALLMTGLCALWFLLVVNGLYGSVTADHDTLRLGFGRAGVELPWDGLREVTVIRLSIAGIRVSATPHDAHAALGRLPRRVRTLDLLGRLERRSGRLGVNVHGRRSELDAFARSLASLAGGRCRVNRTYDIGRG